MISCSGVVKRFQKKTAVDRVSFEVGGGICCVLGPNGAGKSTLLRLMTGLLPLDAGEIRIGGRDLAKEPAEVKRRIGVLPEELGLFDSLTIEEHLQMMAPIYGLAAGLSTIEAKLRGESLLRLLDLDTARTTFLNECSYGMRKKTALALALLHNPQALFLDEPFEGLDPVSSRNVQEMLRTAARRGVTVFLTSHQLPLVERLASRILLLREGALVWTHGGDDVSVPLRLAKPLEEIYFDHAEELVGQELGWLGC
jgi:ABC-2 type transport system ATP-binding protein